MSTLYLKNRQNYFNMGYTKKELKKIEQQAIEAIKQHNLVFIEDVICYIPFGKTTFYSKRLHESDAIKEAIYENRQSKKIALRTKWEGSENATLQMGLYKLLANEDELERLNNNRQKIETDNKHQIEGNIELVFEGLHDLPSNESDIEDGFDMFGFKK